MGLPTESGELDGLHGNLPVLSLDLSGLLSRVWSLDELMGWGAVRTGGDGSRTTGGLEGFQGMFAPLDSCGVVLEDGREGERDLVNRFVTMLRGPPVEGCSIDDWDVMEDSMLCTADQ